MPLGSHQIAQDGPEHRKATGPSSLGEAMDAKLKERAEANLGQLTERKAALRLRLPRTTDQEANDLFGLLVLADVDAVELETRMPGVTWGFAPYDARFLRSLRDQALGVGEQPRPLTKAQSKTLRTIMQRDIYTIQIALLSE